MLPPGKCSASRIGIVVLRWRPRKILRLTHVRRHGRVVVRLMSGSDLVVVRPCWRSSCMICWKPMTVVCLLFCGVVVVTYCSHTDRCAPVHGSILRLVLF